MITLLKTLGAAALFVAAAAGAARAADIDDRVTHGYADSNGVKIHYASLGSGPLVVMIHGFPDYWYTWRQQMEGLADRFQVVAIDQRGYNLSDKPAGVENYDVRLLAGDVLAVIKHLGQQKAIVVGHDWGGVVAWQLAINVPQAVDRLIILNLPHPRGLSRAKYVEAFRRSDFGAMLNYYKRNYPREPYTEDTSPVKKLQMPVLMFHGLKDTALLSPALNGTWDWVEKDLTITTVPDAGHFVQADAPELVTKTMRAWLLR
jgi:epoxide hydrolase 4